MACRHWHRFDCVPCLVHQLDKLIITTMLGESAGMPVVQDEPGSDSTPADAGASLEPAPDPAAGPGLTAAKPNKHQRGRATRKAPKRAAEPSDEDSDFQCFSKGGRKGKAARSAPNVVAEPEAVFVSPGIKGGRRGRAAEKTPIGAAEQPELESASFTPAASVAELINGSRNTKKASGDAPRDVPDQGPEGVAAEDASGRPGGRSPGSAEMGGPGGTTKQESLESADMPAAKFNPSPANDSSQQFAAACPVPSPGRRHHTPSHTASTLTHSCGHTFA